jgi:predicted ArsR family transcriptional regulator
MALTLEVLGALTQPRTLAELAHTLEVAPPQLHATLRVLEARGYVTRVGCAATTSGCGWCSFHATCAGGTRERWARRAG